MPEKFSYDEVECTGQESTLNECKHDNNDDCSVNEGFGVICA